VIFSENCKIVPWNQENSCATSTIFISFADDAKIS
jgi:hypothetical protein